MPISYLFMLKTHCIMFNVSNKRKVNTNDVVIDNQPVSRVFGCYYCEHVKNK